MPMTLAHPAAVLPLRRLGLPMTALVIGSMVPDLPVFLQWSAGRRLTHSVPGLVLVDVPVALLVLAAWFAVARDALADLSPAWVRARLVPHVALSRREALLAAPAAALGALTHLGWDAFTHLNGRGTQALPPLQTEYGGQPGYWWAQWVSAVVGLAVVVTAVVLRLRRLPGRQDDPAPPVCSPRLLPATVALAALVGVVTAGVLVPQGPQTMAHYGVVNSLTVLGVGLAGCCAFWWYARRRTATRPARAAGWPRRG